MLTWCAFTTRDGIQLDGMWQAAPLPTQIGLDAIAFIHGTGGNFYGSTMLDLFADRFLKLGCSVLRVNTRGHDGISTAVARGGGLRLGAAFETVDDCRHDLAACLNWLHAKVGARVGLLGHSLGAVKCLYAVAQEQQLAPRSLSRCRRRGCLIPGFAQVHRARISWHRITQPKPWSEPANRVLFWR